MITKITAVVYGCSAQRMHIRWPWNKSYGIRDFTSSFWSCTHNSAKWILPPTLANYANALKRNKSDKNQWYQKTKSILLKEKNI